MNQSSQIVKDKVQRMNRRMTDIQNLLQHIENLAQHDMIHELYLDQIDQHLIQAQKLLSPLD